MTLKDLIDKVLGRQPSSASTAKERLQLVLAHDRSDLNPELLEQMRKEIREVVARDVEIDVLEPGDSSCRQPSDSPNDRQLLLRGTL
jgi:cell division topological specificity factor